MELEVCEVVTALTQGTSRDLFVSHLGWSAWHLIADVQIPDLDRLPTGWQTKYSTRQLIDGAPKQYFHVSGVAKLGGQVVLSCSPTSPTFWPNARQRRWLCAELARKFYQPLVVIRRPDERHQIWCIPKRHSLGVRLLEYDALSEADLNRLAQASLSWKVTAANLDWATNHLAVQRAVEQTLDALADSKQLSRKVRFILKFAPFGADAVRLAKRAWNDRIWDTDRMLELARRAKDGDREAYERVFRAHMFLVLERAREFCLKRRLVASEFHDFVSAGCEGIASGFENYSSTKGYVPSTLIFYHIDKRIYSAYPKLELPVWIPVHRHERLLAFSHKREELFDRLGRAPEIDEVLFELNVSELDMTEYRFFMLDEHSELWCTDIAVIEDLEARQCETLEAPISEIEIEALRRLYALPDRYRTALMMRLGMAPGQGGDPATLEEIGTALKITRERARQLIMKACKKAVAIELPEDPEPRIKRRRSVKTRLRSTGRASVLAPKIAAPEPLVRGETCRKQGDLLSSLIESESDPHGSSRVEASEAPNRGADKDRPELTSEPPPPPPNISKANAYVEWLLDTNGNAFTPKQIHTVMLLHYPSSIITLDHIRAKYQMRGWLAQPVLFTSA